MKIATLLFTYNRSYHTKQVIDALRQNTVMPQKLFVFQDGLRQDCDLDEWNKVNKLIKTVDWCDKEIIVSECNKGLAASIVSEINYVFEEYDAVIVLEDDCVPTANFIGFMGQCFEKYRQDKRVYSVSGYAWPIDIQKDDYDIYGCGRISSWGWGTWKDRWNIYEKDYELVKKMRQEEKASRNLALWGQDLENILVENVRGGCDSWAVFWALNVISQEGICINPYESLIKNIGMDGSGVHCEITDRFDVINMDEKKEEFYMPEKIMLSDEVKRAFASLYGSYTAVKQENIHKEKILVYGAGNFYLKKEKIISERYDIEAFVDKRKKGWFAGKRIIPINQMEHYSYDKILIMVWGIQECINIVSELMTRGIGKEQILLGRECLESGGRNAWKLSVSDEAKLSITNDQITVDIGSEDEFHNVWEVLIGQTYHFFINNDRKSVVIDVGMNIGSASLYFLNNDRIEKVYGYEPFKKTYMAARSNLKRYLEKSERIEIFQYGLSNENSKRTVGFNRNMSCGQSTLADTRETVYKKYQTMGLVQSGEEEIEMVEVKDAAEVLLPIIQRHSHCNVILKMDCEGEEYGIIEELCEKGVLAQISFIMLEWHYKGKDDILLHLKRAGFSYWCSDKSDEMGLIYAYNMEEKENVCE